MKGAKKRGRISRLPERRAMQFCCSADFRALLLLASIKRDCSVSSYVRIACWNQLKKDCTPNELANYKSSAWEVTK